MRRTHAFIRCCLPIAAILIVGTPAHATWGPIGVPLSRDSVAADAPQIVSDGQGGAFVLWRQGDVLGTDVYAQRITASGVISFGWDDGGLAITDLPGNQNTPAFSENGKGGLILAWWDARSGEIDVYAQHVTPDGDFSWMKNGAPITLAPELQDQPSIGIDNDGGAFIAWTDWRHFVFEGALQVYLQHVDAFGQRDQLWPADGLRVAPALDSQSSPVVLPDGSGGAVVFWLDCRHDNCQGPSGQIGSIYMQRFRADGTIEPGWPEGGQLLVLGRGRFRAMSDGTGGYYVATSSLTSSSFDLAHYLHRITVDGMPYPGWPADGVVVCDAADLRDPIRMAPDGQGGVLLSWADSRPTPAIRREVYAHRFLDTGAAAVGWPEDGLRVSNLLAGDLYESRPTICADGFGGAFVAWQQTFDTETPGLIQHLTADGQVAPDWPPFGVQIAESGSQYDPQVATDGAHGAIVAWASGWGIRANRFLPTGPVSTAIVLATTQSQPGSITLVWQGAAADRLSATVERRTDETPWEEIGPARSDGRDRLRYEDKAIVPGTRYGYRLAHFESGELRWSEETWLEASDGLALDLRGFWPNPSRGAPLVAFALEREAPARIELHDVRGRRIASRSVGELGSGEHVVSLESGARLAPGVYWISLTQGGQQLVRRGVVSE
jgi:hypothetical protein